MTAPPMTGAPTALMASSLRALLPGNPPLAPQAGLNGALLLSHPLLLAPKASLGALPPATLFVCLASKPRQSPAPLPPSTCPTSRRRQSPVPRPPSACLTSRLCQSPTPRPPSTSLTGRPCRSPAPWSPSACPASWPRQRPTPWPPTNCLASQPRWSPTPWPPSACPARRPRRSPAPRYPSQVGHARLSTHRPAGSPSSSPASLGAGADGPNSSSQSTLFTSTTWVYQPPAALAQTVTALQASLAARAVAPNLTGPSRLHFTPLSGIIPTIPPSLPHL